MMLVNQVNLVYPDLNQIFIPFVSLIVLIIVIIGVIIYFAKLELENKGEK